MGVIRAASIFSFLIALNIFAPNLYALNLYAKDKVNVTLALAATQEVERYNDVDDKNFSGQRTGLGIFLESERMKRHFSFEFGLYKANRQYSVIENGASIVEEVDRLHTPILARYYPWKFISIGLGIYGAFAVSEKERAVEENLPRGDSTSAKQAEYGSQASLALNLGREAGPHFVFDLRWLEPFDSQSGEETNNFAGMVGVKFEI